MAKIYKLITLKFGTTIMNNNIPDFQSIMLPFLQMMGDGQSHTLNDLYDKLSQKFNLTEEDKDMLLSSVNQTFFHNRVGCTRTYLKKAGLISSPQRATFIITDEGKRILQ